MSALAMGLPRAFCRDAFAPKNIHLMGHWL